MKRSWLIGAVLFSAMAKAGDLPTCGISVYHLDDAGAIGSEPFIQPRHVLKVEPFKDVLGEVFPEITQWLVTLNSEGSEINRAYTSRNLGGKVAIYCDGREVSRPVIRSVLREQFVFGVQKGEAQ